MTLGAALAWAADQLAAKQIEDPRLEAELLLTHALNIKRSELILDQSRTIARDGLDRYRELVARRLKHEPTAYIIGNQPFCGLEILVDRRVLIPRPETELLVELVLKNEDRGTRVVIADIGTGSGCIAVSLAKALPNAFVYGTDTSADALQLAKKNAERCGVAGRCHFLRGHLLEPLREEPDIVVANPPYIPTAEIAGLQPEVRDWEPREALDGGPDGLKYVREIVKTAPRRLFLEFGFGQAAAIAKLAAGIFSRSEIGRDHAGLERYLAAVL